MSANIQLYRGVTYPSSYQHSDTNGLPLPLTGCTVFVTVKNTQWDDDITDTTNVVFKATITSHTNAAAGLTNWNTLIPSTGVTPGNNYYYDIVVKNPDGSELPPVVFGKCQILGKQTNL